ncbi:hypothetical protein D3C79_943710 [compost metagenome]
MIDGIGNLPIQAEARTVTLGSRLAGGRRHPAAGEQRQADLDADAVGVIALVVAAFGTGAGFAGAGIGAQGRQVAGALTLDGIVGGYQGVTLGCQLGVVAHCQVAPALET